MRGPLIALLGLLVAATLQGAVGDQPSEYECRPYIEKALKESLSSLPASTPEDAGSSEQDADDLEMMQDAPQVQEEGDPGSSQEGGTESASEEEAVGEVSGETGESTEGGAEGSVTETASKGEVSSDEETLSVEGQVSAEEGIETVEEVAEGAAGEKGSSEEENTEGGEPRLESAGQDSVEEGAPESESSEESAEGGSVEEGTAEVGESIEDVTPGSIESTEEGVSESGESLEEGAAGIEITQESAESAESLEQAASEGESSSHEGTPEGGESIEDGEIQGESLEREGAESVESVEKEASGVGESAEETVKEGASLEEGPAGESVESLEGTHEASVEEGITEEGGASIESAEETASIESIGGEATIESTEGGDASVEATGGDASVESTEGGDASVESTEGEEASGESIEGGEASVESKEEGEASVESKEGGEASVESTGGEESVESTEGGEESVEEGTPKETVSADDSTSTEGEKATDQVSSEEAATIKDESESSEEAASIKQETEGSTEEEVISRKPRSVDEEAGAAEAHAEAEEAPAEAEVSEPEPVVIEETPEEELSYEVEIPENLRPREHIAQILRLDEESIEDDVLVGRTIESTLKELKRYYDIAIKPLEILYKYRDLSNRHFGDPEIFSKPLILFMGPWSGGKSSIINYLLDNEYKRSSLRTGAEPSPAYFNILMWGDREEVLDGTQLAADWTFSGLQKFGQGLLDRLRGLRLKNRLLEKVNIVEIPGILEIRKQVERVFPFNDACQWFIDRADIIFLVYDPAKLDVGPETEAILDQLKGREYQTRIVLNKADQVRPEELMRVQGTLIWNISPLMSSTQPPVMYSTSLWSMPYESGAPLRLLRAQERAFLRDMREAIDKRVENKIASARRFAVRVRNHAKMVDCYLTTYYNHKSFFGNRKHISDDIIEKPQDYHIYEGLSTLTNISRYDLPDPETYRDFFRVNPLYEFQQLSATCTYFKGCPINRLDVAIAYDLPELVGKYKKAVETATTKPPAT